MKGQIRIQFDTDNGRMMIDAPMTSDYEKQLVIRFLAAAIPAVQDYVDSPLLKPVNGNGKLHIVKPGGGAPPAAPPPPKTA